MFVSFRITQLYDTGAAVYVYFTMNYDNLEPGVNPVDAYEDIEHRSREVTMQYGGSVSHHHGVGKLRKRFMEKTISPVNFDLMKGIKDTLDPKNIFGINNTIYKDEKEKAEDLDHN